MACIKDGGWNRVDQFERLGRILGLSGRGLGLDVLCCMGH